MSTPTPTVTTVTVEGDASGGRFLITERIPQDVWHALKQAGAWYMDSDQLRDMNEPFAQPGWRYPLASLEVLLQHGYQLTFRDWFPEAQQVTTVDQLRTLFTPEAQATYRTHLQAEEAAREQAAQERAEAEAREREIKGAAYQQWQNDHLAGLVATTADPSPEPTWTHVRFFDRTTPGTFPSTGDQWLSAEVDGATVWQCRYGSAVRYYAPQPFVDAWCVAAYANACSADGWSKGDPIRVARRVIEDNDGVYYGADVAKRLVELHGLDYYLAIAKSEEWLLTDETANEQRQAQVAERHHIPYVVGHKLWTLSYDEQKVLTAQMDSSDTLPFYFYRTDDGRILARQSYYNRLHVLDSAHASLVEAACAKGDS